jgi:cathepsin D
VVDLVHRKLKTSLYGGTNIDKHSILGGKGLISLLMIFVPLIYGISAKQFMPLHESTTRSANSFLFSFSIDRQPKNLTTLVAHSIAYTLVSDIEIGNPAQRLRVLFDTGSTLFWVRSVQCLSQECEGQVNFDSTKSSSHVEVIPKIETGVKYGDGTVINCTIIEDTVIIGNHALENQRLCQAFSIETTSASVDGIIGIGPPKGPGTFTDLFGGLFQSFNEKERIFSIWYNSNSNLDVAGKILIGGVDPNHFVDPILWNSLSKDRKKWSIGLESLQVGDKSNVLSSRADALIDTGSTLVLLPTVVADRIAELLGATLATIHYTVPCDQIDSLPSISFHFSEHTISLNGSQTTFYDAFSRNCYIIFARSNGVIILGAQFLRNVYTVFDWQQERIGFAQRAGDKTKVEYRSGGYLRINTIPITLLLITALVFLL